MKKSIIKLIAKLIFTFILIILISFSNIFTMYVKAATLPETLSPYCLLMDLDSGAILYNKNAYEKVYPASTTKIMTAIVVLEKCKLDEIVPISHYSIFNVPIDYSNANLKEGEELTVENLLYALLIPSANDAAFALAQYVGSNGESYLCDSSATAKEQFETQTKAFYDLMNEEAKNLGCKNTHFENPNGIHSENHYTTAYDLSLMGQKAMTFDIFRKIVSTKTYTLPASNKYENEDRFFKNTNNLLDTSGKYYYEYANGIKTGYTEPAKHCIVCSASKDNANLVAVVLHGEYLEDGVRQREQDCITLFDYGFSNYTAKTIANAGEIKKSILVSGASFDTMHLNLVLEEDLNALLPNDFNLAEYNPNIRLNEDIKAPISKGQELGTISYSINNIDYTGKLVAETEVLELDKVKLGIFGSLFLILFIVIITIIHRIRKRIKRKKRNNSKHSNENDLYRTSNYYRKR